MVEGALKDGESLSIKADLVSEARVDIIEMAEVLKERREHGEDHRSRNQRIEGEFKDGRSFGRRGSFDIF